MIKPEVIFEDANLLVINKPAGLSVHEGHGQTHTLVDWLAKKYPTSPLKAERYGLVHRLDKNTSGVLLIAKTPTWFKYLQELFKSHQVHKEYVAIVHGKLPQREGIIQIPIARSQVYRTRFEASPAGRTAETQFQVLQESPKYSYVKLLPKTGRTHQLRVHLSSLGHPIVGDSSYGSRLKLPRHLLHAASIEFPDPAGQILKFSAPMPSDLTDFLNEIQ